MEKNPTYNDTLNNFKLKPEALDKLGLNPDYTEKEGYVPPETLDYDARLSEIFPENQEEIVVKPDEDKKEEPVSAEQPEKPEDKKETPPTTAPLPSDEFAAQIKKAIEKYETPEERNLLLKDIENREKFWATTTQKSQSVAAEQKVFNDFLQSLSLPEIKSALEDPSLLEALDDWYKEGNKENPFRKFPEILKHVSENEKKLQADFDKQLDEEINALKVLDKKYENLDEVIKLSTIADEKGVNLLVAHELQQSNLKSNNEINTLKNSVSEKDKTIEKLTSELKERNAELSKIRKTGVIEPVITPGASGSPVKGESLETAAVGWDKKTEYLKKHLKA